MIHALRILGYPVMLTVILFFTAQSFDWSELITVILFFYFVVTTESLSAVFKWPFNASKPNNLYQARP